MFAFLISKKSSFIMLLCLCVVACDDSSSNNETSHPPVITSAASISVTENSTDVMIVTASDIDGDIVSFNITGGDDQSLFNIDSSDGALAFNSAPDYESPSDSDGNNNYSVQISAFDGRYTVSQTIAVNVTDVSETGFGLTARPSNVSCSIPNPPVTSSSFTLAQVFSSLSFNDPVALRQSPTNSERWYVIEQFGFIRTFLSGDNSSTIFANLTDRVANYGEMGLLGMAFHPDFANNHYVYVYYSSDSTGLQSKISRFTATSDTQLNVNSELVILTVNQPYQNHNGGNILFGPDGYLYIGLGDGGSSGDPNNYAQNIDSLLGKMLRIDVDNPANGNEYSSPVSNPYSGSTPGRDEIFALGLRNPWRWSFDRLTGQIVLGDVGQGEWEEIDIIVNGGNYGWRCFEGDADYNTSGCSARTSYIFPIHAYDHNVGFSVTGGYVYRGSITSLYGKYIFSDYGTGPIWVMDDPYGTPSVSELISNTTTNAMFVSSFAEDVDGELYVVSYGDGRIYRIETDTGIPSGTFPTLLSQTGCVNPADPTQMAEGVIPYEINAPFWSDGADKDRWFAIPDNTTITVELNHDWSFPNNSVTIKNFSLNNQLVETRLLVKHNDGSWA
ncbi:MAG TPA: PQQ-dependent sugar dehydrogenase, partial [Gammaproteobacteria bacterium]